MKYKTSIYQVIKKIPGFSFNVGYEFQVNENTKEVYFKNPNVIYGVLKRDKEFDGFDFEPFVKMGYMSKEEKESIDCPYEKGSYVVVNKYGEQSFKSTFISNDYKPRNEIYVIISDPFNTGSRIINIEARNVMTGEVKNIDMRKIMAVSKQYWFIDSHGNIKMTYFFLRPVEDKYRHATNNVFNSYASASLVRDKKRKLEVDNIDEFKKIVEGWK